MSVASLLKNLGEDAPSGENLEYDPAFTALELAAQPGEERQVGDQIIEASEPDYHEIAARAQDVLERSHDLRAAVHMANAQLRLSGLTGFAECTTYIRGALEEYWESCHPQLDADDDNDPTMRVNAVFALRDPDTVLRNLRATPLTDSRALGRFSLRDLLIASGEIPGPPDAASSATIAGAFHDTNPDRLAELAAAARQALEDVRAISARFDELTPGQGPDLDPLVRMLRQIVGHLNEATGGDAAAAEGDGADADGGAESGGGPMRPQGGGAPGVIASPADAGKAIDRIIEYYQKYEPSSPVPILLQRAKRLIGADFMAILEDMAPDGMDRVRVIAGIREEY